MKKEQKDYKYLLRLYSQVSDYLSSLTSQEENFPEIVIAFCIVTEKILKIRKTV